MGFQSVCTLGVPPPLPGFQSPMGMHGFSKLPPPGGGTRGDGFNPRWGCMGFQSRESMAQALAPAEFQSPMGMHGFSKGVSFISGDTPSVVSIPDGDAWVFKAAAKRVR